MGKTQQPHDLLILGAGFTGQALMNLAAARGISYASTRRHPAREAEGYVRFNLSDRSTWDHVPLSHACAWLFPAEPVNSVREFLQNASGRLGRIVVLGTTSSYVTSFDGETVTEDTPLDKTLPRVQGEEEILKAGGVVLRAAGIYGPGRGGFSDRNPLDWLRRGLIASRGNIVNLIHVDDLASAILAAIGSGVKGEEFIVTDGSPRLWGEIEEGGRNMGFLTEVRYTGVEGRPSRRLSGARIHDRLHPHFTHTDLFAEIARLEGR